MSSQSVPSSISCPRSLLAPTAALLLAGSLGIAAGSARAEGERLIIRPELTVSQEFNSDERVLDNADRSTSVLEVVPGANVRLELPGTIFTATASVRSLTTSSDRDLDALNEQVRFELRQRLSGRWSASLNGTFRNREAVDPLDSEDLAFDENVSPEIQAGRPDQRDRTMGVGLTYAASPMSSVTLAFSASSRDFSGSSARMNSNREFDLSAVSLAYQRRLSETDVVGLSLSRQTIDFDSFGDSLRDDQEDTVTAAFASWRRVLSPIWSGSLQLGVRLLDTDGGGIRGLQSPLGDGSPDDRSTGFVGGFELVRETPMSRTTLGYNRELRPSGGLGTSLDVDTLSFGHRRTLLPALSLSLRASLQTNESASDFLAPGFAFISNTFPPMAVCPPGTVPGQLPNRPACLQRVGAEVDTDLLRYGVRLDWRINTSLITFLSYDYSDQESSGFVGGRDRDTTRVRFGFRYGYDLEVF